MAARGSLAGQVAVVTGASRGAGRDSRILDRTGQVLRVADLAREYGFMDVDGGLVDAFAMGAS